VSWGTAVRDDQFSFFIKNMGKLQREFPCLLRRSRSGRVYFRTSFEYWSDEGWSGYADGLFWIVDPGQYEDLVGMWL
jgi:hypothetical protein